MTRVGVRELKQNASRVLERVKAGETVEVTQRGQPVALIVPLPGPGGTLERLIAEGRASRGQGSLSDLPPPLPLPPGALLPSQILAELRTGET